MDGNGRKHVSDYQDFCESFGGCASDLDFMDKWMDEHLVGEITSKAVNVKIRTTPTTKNDILPVGKIVHQIKLLATYPAKPMGIIWNTKLNEPLLCTNANYLNSTDHDEPASWFVRKGFTVRSKKINGYWYQIAFKATNPETQLGEQDRKEYESICSSLNPEWIRNCK